MPSFQIVSRAIVLAMTVFVGMALYFAMLTPGMSLDTVLTVGMGQAVLSTYTTADIRWHLWGTAIGDTIFPLAYGTAVILAVLRYGVGQKRAFWIGLISVGVALDFLENALHIPLLRGDLDGLLTHVIVTWGKYICVLPPILWALACWIGEWRRG